MLPEAVERDLHVGDGVSLQQAERLGIGVALADQLHHRPELVGPLHEVAVKILDPRPPQLGEMVHLRLVLERAERDGRALEQVAEAGLAVRHRFEGADLVAEVDHPDQHRPLRLVPLRPADGEQRVEQRPVPALQLALRDEAFTALRGRDERGGIDVPALRRPLPSHRHVRDRLARRRAEHLDGRVVDVDDAGHGDAVVDELRMVAEVAREVGDAALHQAADPTSDLREVELPE
jgi:hypothetical protein